MPQSIVTQFRPPSHLFEHILQRSANAHEKEKTRRQSVAPFPFRASTSRRHRESAHERSTRTVNQIRQTLCLKSWRQRRLQKPVIVDVHSRSWPVGEGRPSSCCLSEGDYERYGVIKDPDDHLHHIPHLIVLILWKVQEQSAYIPFQDKKKDLEP